MTRATFPIAIVLLAALVVLWHGTTGIVDYTDADLPLDPLAEFARWTYTWRAQINGGYANADLRLVPLSLFAAMQIVGFSINISSHLYYVAALSIFGLGSYRLVLASPGPHQKRGIAFVTACAITFGPYTLQTFQGSVDMLWALGMSTLGLSFVVELPSAGYKPLTFLTAALCLTSASIDPFVLLLNLLASCYLLCVLSVWRWHRSKSLAAIKTWVLLAFLVGILNSYWILPTITESLLAGSGYQSRSTSQFDDATSVLTYLSAYTQPYNLIRLMRGTDPNDVTGLHAFESSWPLVSATMFLTLLALTPLLRRRPSPLILGLFSLSLAAQVLAAGSHLPLGGPFTFLWMHVSAIKFFRDPLKFLWLAAPVVTISLGWSIQRIWHRAVPPSDHVRRCDFWSLFAFGTFVIVLTACVLEYGAFWQPSVQRNISGAEIPPSYRQATTWLAQDPRRGRVLVVPAVAWVLDFTWVKSPLGMIDPLDTLSPRPLRVSNAAYSITGPLAQNQRWSDEIARGDLEAAVMSLGDSGVDTILFRDDIKASEAATLKLPLSALRNALHSPAASAYIDAVAQFGQLEIFTIKANYVQPEISLVPANSASAGQRSISAGAAQLQFIQDGPTRYRVFVRHAQAGQLLLLREAFNSGWTLHLRPATTMSRSFFHTESLVAEFPFKDAITGPLGYTSSTASPYGDADSAVNAWPISRVGTFEGIIEYAPQQAWAWGWILAMVTLSLWLLVHISITRRLSCDNRTEYETKQSR